MPLYNQYSHAVFVDMRIFISRHVFFNSYSDVSDCLTNVTGIIHVGFQRIR